jgi:antitoxin PrlF
MKSSSESLIAFKKITEVISEEAKAKDIKEEEILEELEKVREEMWNERKKDG